MLARSAAWPLVCVLLACGTPKDSTGTVDDTFDDSAPFTSTLGMSSNTLPTSTSTDATDATITGDPTVPGTADATSLASESGAPGPDVGLPPGSSSGQYLLAVSTVVSKDLPLQFIATVDAGVPATWSLDLQPLTLDQGKVTSPRQPFGDPLQFTDIAVVEDTFTADLGEVFLPGPTNPITGSDISATLVLDGTIVDADFFCGMVSGMVTSPLMADISGSTFAAVRLADPNILPTDVIINCAGDTRTDM